MLPILPNVSWYPTWNLSGVWQSFTRDKAMMMDEMEIVLTSREGTIQNFTMVCLKGGPTRTCTPGDGPVWNWHNATGWLNLTAQAPNGTGGYRVSVVFEGMKVANQGNLNDNFTTLSWFDHSVWTRKNPNQEADCCKACTDHKPEGSCKAWTLDVQAGTCSLVGSSSNAYPSAFAISGYPLKADPAAWCKQRFLEGGGGAGNAPHAYQDPDMAPGISCAVAMPGMDGKSAPLSSHFLDCFAHLCLIFADTPSSSISFPRAWRDTERHHRGSAWLFFPGQEDGPDWLGHLDGLWTTGKGDSYMMSSSKDLKSFTIECIHGGTGMCDDQKSEGPNGTVSIYAFHYIKNLIF